MKDCIDIMSDRIEELKMMIQESSIPILGNKDKHYMWNLCCVDYFYYDCNIKPKDIKKHWTDGNHDGGIDYVYDDGKDLYLIQGKSAPKLNFNEFKHFICDMEDTIKVFEEGLENKKELNPKIKKAYKDGINNKSKKNIKLVLFTNAIINNELREVIEEWKKDRFFDIVVYDRENIEKKAIDIEDGEKTVEKGKLILADKSVLKYNNGKKIGIIVNIKAKSLQDLYHQKKDEGLFGYNLREYIKGGKLDVDNKVKDTIKNKKEDFWFFNNGITIGCKSFEIRDEKIYLYDFSIINGAQTTTLIGCSPDIDKTKDFSLICKIVKSENSLEDTFIKNISRASNSQKEIEQRDLVANSYEQKLLQYRFSKNKYKLAVKIKRGKNPNLWDAKKIKEWEKIENTKLAQIILAAVLQKPGEARNSPNHIFGDDDLYDKLFNKEIVSNYNYNALYDIVRIQYYFDNYKRREVNKREKELAKRKKASTITERLNNEKTVLNNCGFTVTSIIIYLIKRKYFGLKKINSKEDEEWETFQKKKINTDLSLNTYNNNNKNEYQKNLDKIFDIITENLINAFNKEMDKPKPEVDNASNFFKRDSIYRTKIIPEFDNLIEKQGNHELFKKLEMFNDKTKKENE